MEKKNLLIIPFLAGVVLLAYSWFLSYPLTLNSGNDYIYYHVSIFYWVSVPLLLGSMFLIAITCKNQLLKWTMSVGIMLTIYSLVYFYSMLPSSDSQYFRGLTEYVIDTKNLNPEVPNHVYYQWPVFFILGYIVTSLTGLSLPIVEILLYTIIALLIATGLYLYISKKYPKGGFLMIAAFLLSMTYFFNFQAVPFSLAFSLMLLLFVLETCAPSRALTSTKILLFTGTLFIHSFVPLFVVLYYLIRLATDRNRYYMGLFSASLLSYLAVQLTIGSLSFTENIKTILSKPSEYAGMVAVTLVPIQIPLDATAQFFSRIVTVGSLALCIFAFLIVLLKRGLRKLDKGVLLTGIIYSSLGLVLYTLGTRAIAIAFIPIAAGVVFLLTTKLRKFVVAAFLVLTLLFVFIPIHQSFTTEIQFQTKENHITENLFIEHYNWQTPQFIFANYRVMTYIAAKTGIPESQFATNPYQSEIGCILYNEALEKDFLNANFTLSDTSLNAVMNRVYDSGYSVISLAGSK